MKHIIVASHGPLASAILQSAALIGGLDLVKEATWISIEMTTSHEEVTTQLDRLFNEFDEEDEILALTDVYGGSITTILSEYTDQRNLHILTGVHLGMLLEALMMKDGLSMNELIDTLIINGREGIRYVNAMLKSDEGGIEI